MDNLPIGTHLVTPRIEIANTCLYEHHGVYVGDAKVIHFAGMATPLSKGPIQETTLEEFMGGYACRVVRHLTPKFSGEEVVQRARERMEEPSRYNLAINNCEHFVNWCIEDDANSQQVEYAGMFAAPAVGLPVGASVAFGLTPLVAAEAVAGLSGAGLMSGLAAVGGVVGGGAIVGLAGLAGAPAVLGSFILGQTVLRDRECHNSDERTARKVARSGAYAGAVAGTAGSIGSVYALGSAVGFSAQGITSGLAAVGFGGMATGIMVTVAAPTLVAGVAAIGAYRFAKWYVAETGRRAAANR